RMVNNLGYFEKFPTLIVTAGYLSVDTFFFMSGFLLNYTILKQKKNPALIFAVAIARRFIRATIPLFFVIMCIYLLPLVASGPDSRSYFEKFDREINNHWWALLLQSSIHHAAQFTPAEAERDAFRFNDEQNTLIVSTPVLENALKDEKVNEIGIKGDVYEVVACAIPPENTFKGVILGTPDKDTKQDTLTNLLSAMNPSVAHARRIGR
ncbi:hypothetical protein HPB47_020450, partial [Ixodes persulcatus]